MSSRPPNCVIDYKGTERTVHITQVKPVGKPRVDRPNYVILDDDDESTRDEEAVGPTLNNEEVESEAYDAFQDVPHPVP